MQRRIYIKFESRDNAGFPDKTVERLAIFDDKDDPTYLAETLESWAAETGRTMSTVLLVSKQQAKKLLSNHVKAEIPPERKAEMDRNKAMFNGRKP